MAAIPTKKTSPPVHLRNEHPRAWQRMLSGRRLDILDPSPMDIEIEDIAHGLARVSRWNGQTKGKFPLSVAQHSVLVEKLLHQNAPKLDQKWRLAALLHDSPEYVIGDMITPFKYVLGGIYRDIETVSKKRFTSGLGCPLGYLIMSPRVLNEQTVWQRG